VIGVLAIMIKRESSGPVFFAHNRIGKNGKIIPTLKFRSMYSDAQERLEELLSSDEAIRKEWETNFKLKDDPRVTKIGAVLRKTSLDELPQIFNVLKGEMSFVGPRPVIQKEIEQYYKEDAKYYYQVKPGITGLWQVSGRSDTDYDFRVNMDKWYVKNWSMWLDIVILFKTVKVVLFREGAY
jgi:undecaprenyl-phosphate galactose phosphotransferase